ncbi:transposase family protein [Rhodococcus coprophilus]|uniref:transposase family protein n=1 Tax=Rhodococcus coprophilus TaxID=38310 RepID=UPI0037B09892
MPGSTRDLVAVGDRRITGALYVAAAKYLVALADKGYQGAGIGSHTPTKAPADGDVLAADSRCRNQLLTSLRCLGERAAALLTIRWQALNRSLCSP